MSNTEQELQALSDELTQAEENEPIALTPQQTFKLIIDRYVNLLQQYQTCKLTARMQIISGDKTQCIAAMRGASEVMKRIKALRVVAEESGFGQQYNDFLAAFKAQQNSKSEGDAVEPPAKVTRDVTATAKRRRKRVK